MREFWDFLRYNKKWWLIPIIVIMLLLGLVAYLLSIRHRRPHRLFTRFVLERPVFGSHKGAQPVWNNRLHPQPTPWSKPDAPMPRRGGEFPGGAPGPVRLGAAARALPDWGKWSRLPGLHATARLFSLADARSSQRTMVRNGYPSAYNDELGWIPRPGASGDEKLRWHTTVSAIDSRGFRIHPQHAHVGAPTILAAGDSFTFGDGVNDNESWPANLETPASRPARREFRRIPAMDSIRLSCAARRPSRNRELHPERIVVAFYPDDIRRVGVSDYFAQKPYFILKDDKLVLQNVPVPTPDRDKPSRLKVVMGYSYLLNSIFVRLFPAWWLGDARVVNVQNDPTAVSKKLIDRLAKVAESQHCKVLLVAIMRVRQASIANVRSEARNFCRREPPADSIRCWI